MSKAFTKDEGEGSSEPLARPLGAPLPEGAKNYVTPAGAVALRQRLAEAQTALDAARAGGDANGTLQAQQRLEFYGERAAVLEEVRPPAHADGTVRFGATVATTDEDGHARKIRIVGLDEADAAQGCVSWTSPLARALLGHAVGDEVQVRTPQGFVGVEIDAVSYEQ